MTDRELILLARENNSEAWNALCRRFLPLVWRYAYALLQEAHTAEDIVSETMLALLRNLDQVDAEAPKISAWLRSVVRHKVADHHRRSYRAKEHLPKVGLERQRLEGPRQPDSALLDEENCNQVAEVLQRLPERQRLALEWKYIDGMRVRTIAERLGETEKAVEATLYRARREFRRLFQLMETEAQAKTTVSVNPAAGCTWPSPNLELPKK